MSDCRSRASSFDVICFNILVSSAKRKILDFTDSGKSFKAVSCLLIMQKVVYPKCKRRKGEREEVNTKVEREKTVLHTYIKYSTRIKYNKILNRKTNA